MKLYRLNRYRPLPMPGPDGEGEGGGGGGDGKEAKGLGALANEGKNEFGESAADLDAWKPESDAHFDLRLLPKDLRDKDAQKVIANLYKVNKGFRDAQARAEKPPEKPDGYTFEVKDDKLKSHFPDVGKDPAFLALRDSLHEAGIPQSQFEKVASGVLKRLVDSGALPEPISLEKETEKLGGKDKAVSRYQQAAAWVNTAIGNKVFGADTDALKDALQSLPSTAEGVILIEHLMKGRQEQGMGENRGAGQGGGITKADITERRKDPRYRTDSPKYDKAFRRETDRLARELDGAS